MKKKTQNKAVLKLAGTILLLEGVFFLISLLAYTNNGGKWPWRPGIWGLLCALILASLIIFCGFFSRRAYYIQILLSFMPIVWAIPLFTAGIKITSGDLLQIGITLFLGGLNAYVYYRSTYRKLVDMDTIEKLDTKEGLWNLETQLISPKEKTQGENLANILIPAGVILGTLLSRNPSNSFDATFLFFMACFLMYVSGINIALAVFLRKTEIKIGKLIRV